MSDIIERLQDAMHLESALYSPQTISTIEVMREAKAEIERERKECEEQARLNGMGAEREIALRTEIERLTHTLKAAQDGLKEYGDEMVEARAEIERQRAKDTIERLRAHDKIDELIDEIERLRAMIHPFEHAIEKVEEQGKEIERLQIALVGCREATDLDEVSVIVRHVLDAGLPTAEDVRGILKT
jgi:chromosome segregation ATPase